MKRTFFLLTLFLACSLTGRSQHFRAKLPDDKEQIEGVIGQLFDGMRSGDSSLVHSAFFDEARLASGFSDKENAPATHEITLQDFLNAVGSPHGEMWDERIDKPAIRIDGNMAMAWVPYTFYLGEKQLHCGVNAISLLKGPNGWKIMYIADSRKTEDCKERK